MRYSEEVEEEYSKTDYKMLQLARTLLDDIKRRTSNISIGAIRPDVQEAFIEMVDAIEELGSLASRFTREEF